MEEWRIGPSYLPDSTMRSMALSLLELLAEPWTLGDMQGLWGTSLAAADQWEAALVERGIIAARSDGRYTMPDQVRDMLLTALLQGGETEKVQGIVLHWREQAAARGDLMSLAEAHNWLANLSLLRGDGAMMLAERYCMLALYQAARDRRRVALTSWMIGSWLATHDQPRQALPLLARAAALAEELDMAQAAVYRRRLREIQALLDQGSW